MKVVHINYSDSEGGAAIAAYRHHEAMLQAGIDSKMLVVNKKTNDPNIYKIKKNRFLLIWKIINKIIMKYYQFFAVWSWNHFGNDITNNQHIKNADVIILHWINHYTLSVSAIEKLLKTGKPIFWFMHDMWPITGGCHHSFECEKYTTICGNCPLTHNRKGNKIKKDISFWQHNEKLRKLSNYQNLKILTPSQWLKKKVMKSGVFHNNEVYVVRNILDTNKFTIRDKKEARLRLNLPLDKKLILFGADSVTSPYKGFDMLLKALENPIPNTECVIYGTCDSSTERKIGSKVIQIGRISDINKMIDLYNACDVFVSPSKADNYPNVIIEAKACGLPIVSTYVGGIPEMIEDGKTGRLIDKESSGEELRKVIIEVITNNNYSPFEIRQSAEKENSYDKVISIESLSEVNK